METVTFGRRSGKAAAEWAMSHTTVTVPESAERDAEREVQALLDRDRRRAAVCDPGRARRLDARELRGLPARGPGCSGSASSSPSYRERYDNVLVEDKGAVFNNDLTQAIELGCMLDLACVHARRRASRGRRAVARTPDPHDYPTRDDENFLKHSITRWVDGQPGALLRAGSHDEVGARGEEVLMRRARRTGPLALAALERARSRRLRRRRSSVERSARRRQRRPRVGGRDDARGGQLEGRVHADDRAPTRGRGGAGHLHGRGRVRLRQPQRAGRPTTSRTSSPRSARRPATRSRSGSSTTSST